MATEPNVDSVSALRDWLLAPESRELDGAALIDTLVKRLDALGLKLVRVNTSLPTLHPEVLVRNVRWDRVSGVETITRPHEIMRSSAFLGSPVEAIYRGAERIRCRLSEISELPYPQLAEIKAMGATDYLIVPLPFGGPRRSYISFATEAPGGFTDADLATLDALLPALRLRLELESTEYATESLLHVYLGKSAAERVLAGGVRRGEGQEIEAAIWFCDLRGFTQLGDRVPGAELVAMLDRYFECIATPLEENRGEILKFIGDAVLAIFPVGEGGAFGPCRRALAAARQALAGLEQLAASLDQPLRMGVGLHVGKVMYGNIGARGRLDFTVIGASVNEVSRVESMCKELGRSLLMTGRFVEAGRIENAVSVGSHTLRGVSRPQELFTVR